MSLLTERSEELGPPVIERPKQPEPYINPESKENIQAAYRIITHISSGEAIVYDPAMLEKGKSKLYDHDSKQYALANDQYVFRVPLSVVLGETYTVTRAPVNSKDRLGNLLRKAATAVVRIDNRIGEAAGYKTPQIDWKEDNTFEIDQEELDKLRGL